MSVREGAVNSAVILARGLGTRMRKTDPDAELGSDQAAIADSGMKGMIPIGRPFLDYVLAAVADAGYERVCLVIGPEHGSVREHYTRASPPRRLSIDFAVQEKPLGTADAVLAAEAFAGGEPFVVVNSDNYYPAEALRTLRQSRPPALIAFARSALIRDGNVPPERATRFGALQIDSDGFLRGITAAERSGEDRSGEEIYASMNCWLFTADIFEACRRVTLSPRGELELPRAVKLAIDEMGMRIRVVRVRLPVLDLSTRADISEVERRLKGASVEY